MYVTRDECMWKEAIVCEKRRVYLKRGVYMLKGTYECEKET